MKTTKVAVIQAAPILFDLRRTLEKVETLIQSAAAAKAELILLPEAFIGTYPRGLSFGTVVGSRSPTGREVWLKYWNNALSIPSPEFKKLSQIVKSANTYVVLGVVEKDSMGGTLYCSLLYFSPSGELIGKHRKIKPTAAERIIWGEGDGDSLNVVDIPFGKVGGLICWENMMPQARMRLYEQGVEIYVAPTADSRETWQSSMQHIAMEGRCFVLGCNQFVTKDMYPDWAMKELKEEPTVMCRGGSVVVSPLGEIIAGPLWDKEGILYAELNAEDWVKSKLDFDVVGHYSRKDIFER